MLLSQYCISRSTDKMKFSLGIVLALAVAVSAKQLPIDENVSSYGYFKSVGIPEAKRIRKLEEEYMKNPNRIAGGSPSSLGQIPYQAGLISDIVNLDGQGVCGGSVLSSKRVLTAAHCWWDGEHQAWRLTVVLGSTTLFFGGTRIQTSDVIMHSDWDHELIRSDVAMIRLPTSISFSPIIAPIALPASDESFAGETATASGFGMIGFHPITGNQFLRHVSLNIIPNALCRSSFPNVIDSNICTSGAGGMSTCRGDSGGPLVVSRNNQPVLVGITSFGLRWGCTLRFPAVYARVTSFRSFINQNM